MKKEYNLLSKGNECPAVMEKGAHEIVVVGTLMTEEEESTMKKATNHKIAPYERVVRIPRHVFQAAIDKLLTEKSEA